MQPIRDVIFHVKKANHHDERAIGITIQVQTQLHQKEQQQMLT